MSLITTVGGADTESYTTVQEANEYLSAFYGETPAVWDNLDEGPKEQRLKISALLMNTYNYRGAKASFNQRLAFPRWGYETDEYEWMLDDPEYFLNYSDIEENPPGLPAEIKYAQVEIAYQVVNHLMTLEPLSFSEKEIKMFELGGSLSIEFFPQASYSTSISKARLSSTDIIYAYLNKWYRTVSGGVV
jgi:hypothetical protein